MSDSDSSEVLLPPPPTYKERLVENLSRRIRTAIFSDLITREIFEDRYLQNTYYRHLTTSSDQIPSSQAHVLIITFKVIIKSIAKTGDIDTALLTLTKALAGGASRHVATNFDGYFILLNAFNLRLYGTESLPVVRGKIFPQRMYTLRRIDGQAPPLVTAIPPDSGRIEIAALVQFWYNLTFSMEDGYFNIGDFVNNLCGAVGMSILEDKGATAARIPPTKKGSTPKRPLVIERRAIGSAAGLPPLHLLSIR